MIFLNRNRGELLRQDVISHFYVLINANFFLTFQRISFVLSVFNFFQILYLKNSIETLNVQLAHPSYQRQAPFYDPIWILART